MIEKGSSVWWVGKYWCVKEINLARDETICSLDVSRKNSQGEDESARIELSDFIFEDD